MSIAMFLMEDEVNHFRMQLSEISLDKRLSIVEYISSDNTTYPINKLRNLAIANSKTNHFWLTDLDLWPSGCIDVDLEL